MPCSSRHSKFNRGKFFKACFCGLFCAQIQRRLSCYFSILNRKAESLPAPRHRTRLTSNLVSPSPPAPAAVRGSPFQTPLKNLAHVPYRDIFSGIQTLIKNKKFIQINSECVCNSTNSSNGRRFFTALD